MCTPALPKPSPAKVAAMAICRRACSSEPSRTAVRKLSASRLIAFSAHMSATGVAQSEGLAPPGMADPGLDLLRHYVEHADRGALRPGARRRRDGDQRVQRVLGVAAAADRLVDVVHQLT